MPVPRHLAGLVMATAMAILAVVLMIPTSVEARGLSQATPSTMAVFQASLPPTSPSEQPSVEPTQPTIAPTESAPPSETPSEQPSPTATTVPPTETPTVPPPTGTAVPTVQPTIGPTQPPVTLTPTAPPVSPPTEEPAAIQPDQGQDASNVGSPITLSDRFDNPAMRLLGETGPNDTRTLGRYEDGHYRLEIDGPEVSP